MKKIYIVQFIGQYDRIDPNRENETWSKAFSTMEKAQDEFSKAKEEIISYYTDERQESITPIPQNYDETWYQARSSNGDFVSLSILTLDVDSIYGQSVIF